MSDRGRWIGTAASFAAWWCLVTVVFRLVSLVMDRDRDSNLKSWTTCAGDGRRLHRDRGIVGALAATPAKDEVAGEPQHCAGNRLHHKRT
ncbi:hypothetical protein [Streptomyces hokutonensis]|uniref:hypothetical protein n=1 Tax=Streptomyces hokutonensis TaxID=1306990 RepID=UPI0033C0B09B